MCPASYQFASSPKSYPLPKFPFYNDNPATEKYILNYCSKVDLHKHGYTEDPRLHEVYLEGYALGYNEAINGHYAPLDLFGEGDTDEKCATEDGYDDGQKAGRKEFRKKELENY